MGGKNLSGKRVVVEIFFGIYILRYDKRWAADSEVLDSPQRGFI